MPTNFPASLDNGTSLATGRVAGDTIPASDHDDLANAVIQAETKIGSGSSVPANGQVLQGNGAGTSAWASPPSVAPNGAASGDLSGTYPGPTVAKVNGVGVSGTPSSGQVLTATGSTTAGWATPTSGGMANPMTTLGDLITGGASGTPSRLGVGSTGQVLGAVAGVPGWVTPTSATPTFVNVKAYGAFGDGSHDDTSAIQTAINAALAAQDGTATVYFPAGTYKITATLNCSSATSSASGFGVILRGDGQRATRIFKNSGFGYAVSWAGFGGPSSFPAKYGGMVDMSIEGNNTTGGLVSTVSAQQMFFRGCSFSGSNGSAWDFNTMQDSYFLQCTFNSNGTTTIPVINIYGGAGSNGTSNMLWFSQIRVETFKNGAVWITRGAGATGGGNNGMFWSQCKLENFPTVHGDIFVADSYTQQLCMDQIFISFGNFDSGYSTPANGIVFGDGSAGASDNQASFRNIFMNTGPTSLIGAAVIKLVGGGHMAGSITVDNVFATAAVSNGVVDVSGMSGADTRITQVTANAGTLISGDGSAHRADAGTGTLASGTVTISNPLVQTGSRIIVTPTSTSGASGILYVTTIVAGTSFQVKSSNASDANTFNYQIVN